MGLKMLTTCWKSYMLMLLTVDSREGCLSGVKNAHNN
jgi:hypothetical protein